MKALIVDDEKIIRTGIRLAVPWENIGIRQVFMAASGREALEIVKQEQPDIVITDIQMTEMTGLELIAAIRAVRAATRIIVLTGHDEFDYARECLRMQVQEFLLKPVDEEVLADTVKKQIRAITAAREQEVEQNHMNRIFGTTKQMELEGWMRKLIAQEDVAETVRMLRVKYHYSGECRLRLAILIPSVYSYGIRKGESESLSILTIKSLLMGYLDAGHRGITFEDAPGHIVVALFIGDKSDDLENCVNTFTKLIQEECDVKLRIVMGNVVDGFARAYLSYNDAVYLLEKENSRYSTGPERKSPRGQLDLFREVYGEFMSKLSESTGNTEQILRIFTSFCAAADSYNITDQYVAKCCFEIATAVYFSYTVESGETADSKIDNLLAPLLTAGRDEKYEITRSFLENLLKVEEGEARELVAQIKYYINEHLAEDISVAGIAATFFLSPNYFSRLFKRIMQEGCNEYIVRKRIENAEYLLATTGMKIGMIAGEVGYRDTNYFSLAFKKQIGLSPLQYREQSVKDKKKK